MTTLRFEDGTVHVGIDDSDSDADADVRAALADVASVEADPRSGGYRAPAMWYAAIRDALDAAGVGYDDRGGHSRRFPLAFDGLRPPRLPARRPRRVARRRGSRGVVELPTGAGKTVLAVAAMVARSVPTLVVVPTIDLQDQWIRELETEFDVAVGRFGGGEQTQEAITVSTYDSAYLRADGVGGDFGLVVFDEVHHLGGEGYQDIPRFLAAPARLGLTATFERPDGAHERVEELVGPRVYRLDVDDLAGDHLADYEVRRIEVELTAAERETYDEAQETFVTYLRTSGLSMQSGSDYQKLVMRSGNDPRAREALLAKQRARDVMMNSEAKVDKLARLLARHREDRVIVFTASTDLVYRISRRFLVPPITNETGTSERREILDRFRDGTYDTVVAANVLDEGVDVPDANVGILLSGSGSEREFTQRLGRILRPKADGATATLYELVSVETAEERVAARRR